MSRWGKVALASAAAVLVLFILGRTAVGFYTDILWYDGLGYLSTYWARFRIAEQVPHKYVLAITAGIAALGGWWLAELHFGDSAALAPASWSERADWGLADPLFGRDAAFYVLSLPVATRVLLEELSAQGAPGGGP